MYVNWNWIGRLEVHMEIGLPDEYGRLQILKIHTFKVTYKVYCLMSVGYNEFIGIHCDELNLLDGRK